MNHSFGAGDCCPADGRDPGRRHAPPLEDGDPSHRGLWSSPCRQEGDGEVTRPLCGPHGALRGSLPGITCLVPSDRPEWVRQAWVYAVRQMTVAYPTANRKAIVARGIQNRTASRFSMHGPARPAVRAQVWNMALARTASRGMPPDGRSTRGGAHGAASSPSPGPAPQTGAPLHSAAQYCICNSRCGVNDQRAWPR